MATSSIAASRTALLHQRGPSSPPPETLRAQVLFEFPDSLIDEIAERAAARVLEQLDTGSHVQSQPEFLTVAEAAELLRARPQRVYDLLSDGRLERFKDGSRVLVRRADVVAHVLPNSSRGRMGRTVAR